MGLTSSKPFQISLSDIIEKVQCYSACCGGQDVVEDHYYDMRALCLHNVTHIRDPSIIVYMPTRGCLSFFFFFLFLHDALSQLGLGHQNETWCQ